MGLFSKPPLDRKTLETGDLKKIASRFTGKQVVLEELDFFLSALEEPALRDRLRAPEIVGAFTALLAGGDEVARQRSAQILGALGAPEAIPALAQALRTDANNWIRGDAAKALGRLGTDAVVEPLLEAVAKGDFAESFGAAEALAMLGDPRGIQATADRIAGFADEGVLAGRGRVGSTVFYIWPQYKGALEKISSRDAALALVPLLGKLYADPRYQTECATGLIYLILATGGEDTLDAMSAVVPRDVLDESLEHHRFAMRLRSS